MKKIDKKSKPEQLFVLMLLTVACLGILALTGCGGNQSCETVQCGSIKDESYQISGLSVPGCGGCLDSGKGCDSCLWAQSCKEVSFKYIEAGVTKMNGSGCDIQYYGSGCLGCGYDQKSCYSGCIKVTDDDDNSSTSVFYGNSDDGSHILTIGGDNNGCVKSGNWPLDSLRDAEVSSGIN